MHTRRSWMSTGGLAPLLAALALACGDPSTAQDPGGTDVTEAGETADPGAGPGDAPDADGAPDAPDAPETSDAGGDADLPPDSPTDGILEDAADGHDADAAEATATDVSGSDAVDTEAAEATAPDAADTDTGDSDAADTDTGDTPDAADPLEPPPDLPSMPGTIPAWQRARQADFLVHSCSVPLDGRNPMHLLAHLACARRLGYPDVPADAVPLDAFDEVFDKMYRLRDTSDFDATRLVNLLYAAGDHPALPAALRTRIEDALLSFKFWFTDPTPAREVDGKPVVDSMWYWSENHVLIFRMVEFLMGQRLPDRTFTGTGQTGAWHRDRARAEILRWLDERARWGFSEWHSDVYYNWDMNPLISLVEWSDDPEVARRAAMVLDLFWLDVALHVHRGNFGVTHGRSYIKDLPAAVKEDTFDATKLFFDDTDLPWNGAAPGATVLFARSEKYAMPYAIRAVARHESPMEDRERMNVPVPEEPPAAYDTPLATPPYGLAYDEANLSLWWSMGAFTSWPLLPLTLDVATRYGLWEGQFDSIAIVAGLLDLTQPVDVLMQDIFPLYKEFWRIFNSGLLKEVHTKTFRSAHAMLSSVQDYRKGSNAMQVHAWQATLDETAVVFTQHPGTLPLAEGSPVPPTWDWQSSDEHGAGYWTGDSSLPRIGQHRDLAVIIYAPQYQAKPLGLKQFDYRDETHAYFPHAHFDEVVQDGRWTFGRKGGGYVALWSFQPTHWREGQPEVFDNRGLPFDLVADGAQNAWAVQVGDADEWGSFEAFTAALAASAIAAEPVADSEADGFDDGYRVTWEAPRRGTVTFGWAEPLTVAGADIPLRWDWRFDNPFVRTRFDDTRYDLQADGHRLFLDFSTGARLATPAPARTLTAVTFNTGTSGTVDPSAPPGGYGRDQAELEDLWYGNGLAWKPSVEAAKAWLAAADPDVVTFQEIFHSGDCAGIPPEATTGFCCEDYTDGDPTVAQAILGPEYQVMCHAGQNDKCAGVHRRFGRFRGCDADFCLEGMAGSTVDGCGKGARIGRGVIDLWDGGGSLTLVNIHGSSGISADDQQCRVRQLEQVFVNQGLGDGQPAANGARNLVMGDFNTDPGRLVEADPSAARLLDFAGDGKPFRFLTDVGPDATPTYAGLFNIDHVLSDTLTGTCWAAGVTDGHPPVTDIVYFDHHPVACTLVLGE